jgi:hypothetical protein
VHFLELQRGGLFVNLLFFLVSGELQPPLPPLSIHIREMFQIQIFETGNRCLMYFLMIIYAPYICKTWIDLDLKSRRLFLNSTGAMAVAIRWKRP